MALQKKKKKNSRRKRKKGLTQNHSCWILRRVSWSNDEAQRQKLLRWAQLGCRRRITDLDGRFSGDVRHQEVHGNVLAVDVLVHHVPDGLGHHVGVQIGVVLRDEERKGKLWQNSQNYGWNPYEQKWMFTSLCASAVYLLTLWKNAAPVRTMESSQE